MRRAVLLTAFAVLWLAAIAVTIPARAQDAGPPAFQLVLDDKDESVNTAPYFYITPDPRHSIAYKDLIDRFNSGDRGQPGSGHVISLGASGTPAWIIMVVKNESWVDDWMLSFGQHQDGRTGNLRGVAIYEHVTHTRYIDTVTAQQNPFIGGGGTLGTALRVNLARGQLSVFVMYVIPQPGRPVTLAPRLITEKAYLEDLNNPVSAYHLLTTFFVLMAAFFCAALLFSRLPGSTFFVLYYIAQLSLFEYQNNVFYGPAGMGAKVGAAMYVMPSLIGLLAARSFFGIRRLDYKQNRILLGIGLMLVIAIIGTFFVLPESSAIRPYAIFVPVLVASSFLCLLGLARSLSGQAGARLFALGWGVMAASLLTGRLGALGLWPDLTPAAWYASIIQGVLFIAAALMRDRQMRKDDALNQIEDEDSAKSIGKLRQSKEYAENNRLKRLIEHERAVMNEMREREVGQNEELRKSKDFADEANRAKSAFLAVISHEIRTPMTGIMGMVRLMLDSQLDKAQLNYAQTIQDSGDAMISLLNDILDFEKIESGKMDLEHIDFDMGRVVNGIVTLMSGHAAAKGLYLKSNISPDLPRFVVGDPVRLRQVLLNLSGNSIKFTNQGGVTLHVKPDPSADTRSGTICRIRFAVEDTGIGISKDAQKNLFNPFAQADSSISRKFGGTGLGLAISQRLIEAMGGHIHIDSTEGSGSTFFFTLIMETGSAEAAEGQNRLTASQPPSKRLRILVVEDNEINQKLLQEFMQRFGHETYVCGRGEDALLLLESETFDLIFMDMELPGISGTRATRTIRTLKDRKKAAIPIIALTGNVRAEDVAACYKANMNGYLAKPVDPKRLRDAIEKAITGRLDNPIELQEPVEPPQSPPPVVPPQTQAQPAKPDIKIDIPMPPAAGRIPVPVSELPEYRPSALAFALKAEDMTLTEEDLESDSFSEAVALDNSDAGTADDPSVFDHSMLDSIKGTMKISDLRALMDGLFTQTEQILNQLSNNIQANDIAGVTARAHELKGMAGNYGLAELAGIASDVEKAARGGEMKDVQALVRTLPEATGRARRSVEHWMTN